MSGTIENLVNDIPAKGRKWLLILLLVAVLAYVGGNVRNIWPSKLIEPVQAQVESLDKRVGSLEQRYDRYERFMCYQDRRSAILAGINCQILVGP